MPLSAHYKLNLFFLLAIIFIIGCGEGVIEPVSPIATETRSAVIFADAGGNIAFSDGTVLAIPAGALPNDTLITVEKPANLSELPGIILNTIYLTAESMAALNSPATLTVKYNPALLGTDEALVIALASPVIAATTEGGETSQLEYISPEAVDPSSGLVTFKINHFSRAYLWKQKKFYLVFDIPGKYLKKSDILYTLTNASGSRGAKTGARWFPGHVALYLGSQNPDSSDNDGDTIIESTDSSKYFGVQYNSLYSSFKHPSHIYLGAYRPQEFSLTESERILIAHRAYDKLAWSYSMVQYPTTFPLGSGPLAGPQGITCVALVEDAYDEVGKSILTAAEELLLLPIDQFVKTSPVEEVSVEVGSTLNLGVYGVSTISWFTYSDNQDLCAVTAESVLLNQGKATFFRGLYDYAFSFTPTSAEANSSYTVVFTGDCGPYTSVNKLFTINVGPAPTGEVADYLTLASLTPAAGSKVTREVVVYDIAVTFDYKLSATTAGTYETGILHLEFGGMHGTDEVTYGILQANYGNGTIQTLVTEEAVPLGSGSRTFNVQVSFPAHDPGYTIFDYSPFFWAKLTRPSVYERHFDGQGPDPIIVNYRR